MARKRKYEQVEGRSAAAAPITGSAVCSGGPGRFPALGSGHCCFPRVKARPAGESCRYFKRRGGSGNDS